MSISNENLYSHIVDKDAWPILLEFQLFLQNFWLFMLCLGVRVIGDIPYFVLNCK